MSLLLATQITAIATAVLALLAIATALFAGLAFRKQSAEVALLQAQAKRDSDDRRRAQASHVFLTKAFVNVPMPTGPEGSGEYPEVSRLETIRLTNSSDQPVFDVTFAWYWNGVKARSQQLPPRTVMPGSHITEQTPEVFAKAGETMTADATFRDAAGVWWRRGPSGQLDELDGDV